LLTGEIYDESSFNSYPNEKESKSLYKPTNNLGNGLIRISSM